MFKQGSIFSLRDTCKRLFKISEVEITRVDCTLIIALDIDQGPVVQSIASLTSSLVVKMLTDSRRAVVSFWRKNEHNPD